MTKLTVGRSEAVAYANNNLTYKQFKHPVKPILKETNTQFIDSMVQEIKDAKSDDDIRQVLCEVYYSTQYDSSIRAEFDSLFYK